MKSHDDGEDEDDDDSPLPRIRDSTRGGLATKGQPPPFVTICFRWCLAAGRHAVSVIYLNDALDLSASCSRVQKVLPFYGALYVIWQIGHILFIWHHPQSQHVLPCMIAISAAQHSSEAMPLGQIQGGTEIARQMENGRQLKACDVHCKLRPIQENVQGVGL